MATMSLAKSVRPRESLEWTRRLADVGVFAGISSGASLAGAVKVANRIDEGVIVAVGPADAIDADYVAAERLDGSNRVVLPGLVNGHTHAAMTLLRGVADDLALMDWLQNYIFPAEVAFVDAEFVRQFGSRDAEAVVPAEVVAHVKPAGHVAADAFGAFGVLLVEMMVRGVVFLLLVAFTAQLVAGHHQLHAVGVVAVGTRGVFGMAAFTVFGFHFIVALAATGT